MPLQYHIMHVILESYINKNTKQNKIIFITRNGCYLFLSDTYIYIVFLKFGKVLNYIPLSQYYSYLR